MGSKRTWVNSPWAFVGRGYDIHVFTRGTQRVDEVIDGAQIHRFAARSENYTVMPHLWMELRHSAAEFDLVHAHSYHALPALAAAVARPRRFVFTPHFHGTGHSPLRKSFICRIAGLVAAYSSPPML